ncbi:MAG: isopentenyl-diphosphate Delta-isomerase [Actinomycetota bacterium]|nr:isopentenyl-diphosphate Delta-isomerase [Actinomycetota bacterium]
MSTCEPSPADRGASCVRDAVPPPLGPSPTVELVDADGACVGELPVDLAHTPPGRLHRAFSVLVVNGDGRVLLQRRARAKSRFAGRWSNTCCGHPVLGQDLARAAAGRLRAEMGLEIETLTELGRFVYQAYDPTSPFEEHEYDHVFLGSTDRDPLPDPDEADAWRWADRAALADDLSEHPDRYSPWLPQVLAFLPTTV